MSDQSSSVQRRGSALSGLLANRGFVACVVLLTALASAYEVRTSRLQKRKLPVPLKQPLDALDRAALRPYELVHPYPPIKDEILDALGTDQYLQWLLQDTSIAENVPEKYANLFITYYTGNPDQVPHVPEICYQAQGNVVVSDAFDEVPVPAMGDGFVVPIKVLEFEGSRLLGRQNSIVMYTFHANGVFYRDRRDVQTALGSTGEKYAYFSKLELSFGNQEQAPDRAKALQAGKKFLQIVIPVLLRDHWPDWPPAEETDASR